MSISACPRVGEYQCRVIQGDGLVSLPLGKGNLKTSFQDKKKDVGVLEIL